MSARHNFGRYTATVQAGLTLVELMVAMTLGLFIAMAATALFLSTKSGYVLQDETTRLQETGQYAIESITRAVHQAAYQNWDGEEAPVTADYTTSAAIAGLDASSLSGATEGISAPLSRSINGSDVLALRFFGAGSGAHGDGSITNCAGAGVAAPATQGSVEQDRGWSIFYVANDASGEPELRCKYRGEKSWSEAAIGRGVEAFQVLYGLDSDADGIPDRFLTATAINALDQNLPLAGADPAALKADLNRKTNWKKVVAIKIAVLVRGTQNTRADALPVHYDLFDSDYSAAYANTDSGVLIDEASMPVSLRNRNRKVFASTIQVRNRVMDGGA